jgi:uncharacterized membrane protein
VRWQTIHQALHPDFGMGWNFLLALAPVALALLLFRRHSRPGLLWWPGLLAFVLVLPNASYTLTDVIHLVSRIRREPLMPVWTVSLVLLPQYAAFMFAGLQSHVFSLILAGGYLRRMGKNRWVVPMEVSVNVLCALGVYFGRFQRANSWDVIDAPERLALEGIQDLTERLPLEIISGASIILIALYYFMKMFDVALIEYWQRRIAGWQAPGRF